MSVAEQAVHGNMHPAWLLQTADALVCQLMEECAGIRLAQQEASQALEQFAEVYTEVDGTYHALLTFRAEWPLFRQLTENMLGEPISEPDDVEEYTKEFFNVLCGRLVSEIFILTKSPARFYPPCFLLEACEIPCDEGAFTSVLSYRDEEGDRAELRWTSTKHLPACTATLGRE